MAVSGATGFVGRYVISELMRRGLIPTIVVRPSTPVPPQYEALPTVRFDLSQRSDDTFDQIGRPDLLLHLAWGGLPNYSDSSHFERELPLHYGFLKNLIEGGLSSLLVTGTCLEYGMQNGRLSESLVTEAVNSYAFAKDALHRQLTFLKRKTRFSLTWARLFYLYGEGQAPSSIYSQLQEAARRGEQVFRMSAGEQLRDYLPVEKAAEYLVALALQQKDLGPVNVCSGRPVAVRSMVETWISRSGYSIAPMLGYYGYAEHEPHAFWGDNDKLLHCLNSE